MPLETWAFGVARCFLLDNPGQGDYFSGMRLSTLIFAVAVFPLAGCAGVGGQQKSMDELSRQVAELRISMSEANSRIDDLGNKIVLLQEKIEETRAEVENMGTVPVAPPEGLKVVPLSEEGGKRVPAVKEKGHGWDKGDVLRDASALYNEGQDLFMAGRYEEARKIFSSFLGSYPRHTLSDNALYWIGETYYSAREFEKALEKFSEVVDKYPEENKAPDALLKAGFSYQEMKRDNEARAALERLVKRYPGSHAASIAAKALGGLKGER